MQARFDWVFANGGIGAGARLRLLSLEDYRGEGRARATDLARQSSGLLRRSFLAAYGTSAIACRSGFTLNH